jgi:hypothetical protein
MTSILENTLKKTMNIENEFKHKKILFIPSESYDATTIGIIEGLNEMNFEILVYKKNNVNSWFCNKIIDSLENIEDEIDFVLSNLHWGTRWSYYKCLNHKVPYILIDGDDRIHGDDLSDWKNKYKNNIKNYRMATEEIKNKNLSPFRWMEKLENYEPDIVFFGQKYKVNKNSIFLPTSISNNYLKYFKNREKYEKIYDVTNIPGPGTFRDHITYLVEGICKNQLKLNVWNQKVYGNMLVPDEIRFFCENDNNVHSWHRWKIGKDYQEKLMSSKILIVPPVDKYNAPGGIGIKRVTEGLAAGCFILFHQQPDFDDSTYPIEELCPFSRFKFLDYQDCMNKIVYLLKNPKALEFYKNKMYENALKYYTSLPITRYFLWNINNKLKK